jgi:hypothetical protein
MSDAKSIITNMDLLHNQTQDFLSCHGVESFGLNAQFAAKLR